MLFLCICYHARLQSVWRRDLQEFRLNLARHCGGVSRVCICTAVKATHLFIIGHEPYSEHAMSDNDRICNVSSFHKGLGTLSRAQANNAISALPRTSGANQLMVCRPPPVYDGVALKTPHTTPLILSNSLALVSLD